MTKPSDSSKRLSRHLLSIACFALALAFAAPVAVAAPPTLHVIDVGGASPTRGASRQVQARRPQRQLRRATARHAKSSSMRVGDATNLELRTNGKIIAIDPREGHYSCSGTAINTPSKSVVLTAGHCAIENGSAGRKIVFVPAYDHGKRPFGTFTVSSVFVIKQWRHGENPDFDVAALRVKPNELGALTDVVGGRGYAVSRSRTSSFEIFGYPAAALRGEELRSCHAHGLGSDPFTFVFDGPPTLPTSCDMAAGASGGAWIIDGQLINGVTSYSYLGRPSRLYSPYFGKEIGVFLRALP